MSEDRNSPSAGSLRQLLMASILPILIGFVLSFLLIDSQKALKEIEVKHAEDVGELSERIQRLETQFELCVDCSFRKARYGDFEWQTFRGYDLDKEGRVRLGLDIDVLSEQFRWDCGSSTSILWGDSEIDLSVVVGSYARDRHLGGALGLVALGTASSEGEEDQQERLARRRVETLVNILYDSLREPIPPIWGYNLGQFVDGDNQAACTSDTLDQRRVVLLKIIEMQSDLPPHQLDMSIRNILLKKVAEPGPRFPVDIRDYSRFKGRKRMLVQGRGSQP